MCCRKRCPVHAAVLENGKLKIDDTSCIHCGICSNACHFGAIEREAEPVFRIFCRRNVGEKQTAWELFCRNIII